MTLDNISGWLIQLSIHLLDFIMIYLIGNAMTKRSIKINLKHIGICLLYVTVANISSSFLGENETRLIITLLILFLIKFVIERKLGELLIIYGIFVILSGTMQTLFLGLIGSFELTQDLTFLIVQFLTTVIIYFICKKLNLHQWLYALQVNVVLKLISFFSAVIILIVIFFLNFEHHFSYYVFFSSIFILIGIVLIPILISLYHKVVGIVSIHDLHNSMLSLGLTIADINDPQIIRDKFKAHSKSFGMDLSQLDALCVEDVQNYRHSMERKFEVFIDTKKQKYGNKSDIDFEIYFSRDYKKINDSQIIFKWLGILLDNALEENGVQPIFIYLYSAHNIFTLKISNQSTQMNSHQIKRVFEKGYSTKGEARGVGLYNLYKEVNELGGIIEADVYWNSIHNCQYLELSIIFKNEGAH